MAFIKCCLCEEEFDCGKTYFDHINNMHSFIQCKIFRCTFKNCYQQFNSKYVFKRHILKHFERINETYVPMNVESVFENTFSTEEVLHSETECNTNIQDENINASPLEFCYEESLKEIGNSATKFIIKLNSFNNISRSDINFIRTSVTELILNPIVNFIKECVNKSLIDKTINTILDDVKDIFSDARSEFILEKTMKDNNLLGTVEEFVINNNRDSKGVVMPLEFQIQKLFEQNDYLDDVITHMKEVEKNPNCVNFIQGDLWKQKKQLYPNKTLIPYYLYTDDFGINNPLGSKATKHTMCNFYYSFSCVPKKSSKLNEVFLACSLKSSDVKKYKNECFKPLVRKLQSLEIDGIDIKTKEGIKKVHFVMALLLGDNLGLNCTLGFSKSFASNYYCRFCLMNKCDARKNNSEVISLLRNRINYRETVERELAAEMGISSNCEFDAIPSFHCTENYAVDVMHDIFEGKYFSLDELNKQIKMLSYSKHDKGYEKISISIDELKKHRLKMSAKQMLSFCYYFPLLIGEFIPFGDEIWSFLLEFFELIDDILRFEITNSLIQQISIKIENVNKNYQLLFKKNLTPKFHFLTHYSTIMNKSGPLRNLWSFKYEGKHKQFKMYANVITSRKNVPLSFSYKQQMFFANFLLENNLKDEFFYKKPYFDINMEMLIRSKLQNASHNFTMYLEANIWGYTYSTQHVVATFVNSLKLFNIVFIIKAKNNQVFLCCKEIYKIYNHHYASFECGRILTEYTILNLSDIVGPPDIVDMDLQQLLTSWNLPHLYELLHNHRITIDVLPILKPHHISKLFNNSHIADEAKFELHLDKYKENIFVNKQEYQMTGNGDKRNIPQFAIIFPLAIF
ncbi:hypothetical protein CVS40_6090 [Lucilia cuprina]|nr:hypothetical protein CVS40_6090 [Lucilia cuprina]